MAKNERGEARDPPTEKMADRPILIGIIGGEHPPASAVVTAEQVGRLIAKRGGIVVCGGLGGVMEAVCRGARSAGALTIGILPGPDNSRANPYVAIPIVTAIDTARNAVIVRTADALIAIDGNYGTLNEITYALDLKKRPVLLESWPLDRIGVDGAEYVRATTPEEAVERAFELARARGR
jgi:hypothetical protein